MTTRQIIKQLLERAIKKNYGKKVKAGVEKPQNFFFGDYATNVAMMLKQDPNKIALFLKSPLFEKVETKRGFINFFLSKEYLQKKVGQILKQGERFGDLKIGRGERVNVEFVSANPTGPLTLGNGRGGFCGDCLANILERSGFKVTREYYINDRGKQVVQLGHSVIGDEESVYKGNYIEELKGKMKGVLVKGPILVKVPAQKYADRVGEKAANIILKEMIKPAVKKMGIKFDTWFSEKSLYKKGEIKKTLSLLRKKKLIYEKEGAFWFKSIPFGDDKDRVLIKEDGEETYFLSDIAYLTDKINRGFKKIIFFLGADHSGYVQRIKAIAKALGFPVENIDIIIMQLVKLFEKGKEVRMSKRAGIYLTIEELIDEVGLDVARFFFLQRSPDSHLNFDLDLARKQSAKNPVYYIQYAHARICSILRKSPKYKIQDKGYKTLSHPGELNLIRQLIRLPEVIEDTVKDRQVQRIPQYALDLATTFHQFYRDCKVISDNNQSTKERLALVLAAKIILKNTLSLMGIFTPEKM